MKYVLIAALFISLVVAGASNAQPIQEDALSYCQEVVFSSTRTLAVSTGNGAIDIGGWADDGGSTQVRNARVGQICDFPGEVVLGADGQGNPVALICTCGGIPYICIWAVY